MRYAMITLLLLTNYCSYSHNRVVHYQPTIETFTGTLKHLTFPGPPNYESIAKGDEPEKGPYLALDKPIDAYPNPVVSGPYLNEDTPEKNIKLIQLAIGNESDWKLIYTKCNVRIKGSLFRAFTGHHHTKVVMSVDKIEPICKIVKISLKKHNETF